MLIKLEHEKTGGITKVDDFEVVNSLKSKEISGENKIEVIDEDIKIVSGISKYEVEGVKYQINNNFVLNNNVYVNNTNIFNTTIDQKGKITITDPAFSFEMYLDEDKILSEGANHQNNSLSFLDIMETQDLEYILNNNYVSVINTFKSYNFSSIDFNIFSNELDIEYDKTNKCLNLLHKGETAIYKIDEFSILNQYNEVMDGLNIELKDYNKLSFSFDSNVKPIYLCFNIHKVSKPIVSISNTCNDKFVYSDFTKLILGHKRGLSYNLDISCDTEEIINVMSNYLLDDYKVQLILPYVQGIRAENSLGFNAYYQENLLQTSKYLDNSNLITIDITNEIAKQIDNYKKGFSIYDLKISIESIKDINRTIYDDYIEVYGFLENNLINKPYILITRDNEFKMYDGTPELEINNLRSGKLAFNLHHKKFKHKVDLGNVRSKNLSVPVSLLYDERISNINNHVGLGFKLNLNQRLERAIFSSKLLSSKEIKYYDANNNCHMLYEKWFYEQNNVRHYIIKDKVYIGSDQKLKYKNEDGTEFDVEYEVVSDNNLRFISLKDQYTYHSKDDMKCNKKYYMLLENHTKLELEFNNGFVRVPHFYSLVSASANVSINDLIPESRTGNTPYTTLDSINKSTINYVKCYKYENGKYYDIYNNELGVEYIDSPILYENEKYYVRGLSKKHIIHLDDNDSTFYSKFDDSYKINVIIDKEYYLDKSVKLTDINQTEDLANVENQIIETENYINSLKEQAKQISDNVISYENEYYHYDIMNGIEKMLNSLREEINNTSESETYTEEIQTLIDSYNELSEKYKLDKYNYDMKNLHNNICDLNNQLRESLNTLTTYEIKLQNLYEIKENLIKSLKNEVQDVILDEEGNYLGFDYFGKLVNIVDAFENEISINYYNDRIVSIIGKDEKIYLKYNDKDLVETLTNNDGIEYKFYYEDNKLIKISYFGDRNEVDQMLFEYNDNNILNVITDASGLKVRFTNLDNNMYFINQYSYVSSFTTENINMQNNIINIKDYLIEYENNKITVKDNIKNTLNLYYLDKKGRLIYSYYNDLDKRNSLDNLDIEKWDYYLYEDKDLKYNVLLEEKNKLISLGSYAMDSFSVCGDIYLNDENNIYNINLSHRRMLLGLVLNNLDNYDMLNYNVSVSVKVYDKNANIKTSNYTYENSSYENIIVPIIVTENDVYIEYMFTFEDDISTFDFGSLHVYEATGNIYTYNEEGIVIKSENEEEEITYADFILKKPTKIIKVDSLGEEHITYKKYNEQGLMTYTENSDGTCLENYYDEKGNILEKRTYNKNNSSVGEIIRYKYDEKGLLVTEDDNKKVTYLPNNFVSKIETKSGSVTCYGRDFNTKNLIEITHSSVNGEVTNTQNQKYKFGYVTECSHNGCTYKYVLDSLGRKKEVKIDGTLIYKYEYDDSFTETIESVEIYHGTKTTFINAISNRYISEYKYKDGRIAIKEYGQILDSEYIQDYYVKYIYDAKDRLIKVEEIYPDNGGTGSTIESEYGYNDLINFKKYNVTDKYVKETYTYDDLDRVTFIKQDVYDEGVEHTYSYDDEDRITNVSTNFNINSNSTYDSQDRINTKKVSGINLFIEEDFDYVTKSDNVTNLVNNHIVRINNEEVKINEYTYDYNGNIINVYNGYNTDYVYDKLGRLIRENNEELDKSITYKYDKAGNIIQKQTSDYTLETKLTNTLKDNYIYSGTSWKDKLIKFNDITFEYDNLGRPVKIGEKTLTWNNKGKLASYDNVTFDYDINGFRKSKTANGVLTKYYTFGNRIVREERNGTPITYIYNVDKLLAFCYNGNSYIYERNILGDIIGIYNANTKEKVATYAYTGYGEHVVHNYTSNNIGDINPFRYRGYYYDVETQLFYCNSRYYSPELCRFISPDSIEYLDPQSVNGLNLYCYCMNNPVMCR